MNKMEIVILGTSDIHGSIYPINYGTNEPADVGLGKIATLVQREREQSAHTILIDNGDFIQGTPLTYNYVRAQTHQIHPMVLLANEMEYDAAVFGNHEFNYGPAVINKVVSEANFPYLSATILNKKTMEPYFGTPYKLKEFPNGVKVGILGLTTPYIPNWEKPEHIKDMDFIDAVTAAKKWVKYLREEEKVDLVVVSYHGGFERNLDTGEPTERMTGENQGYQLCQEVVGIDVLLTGHQHRRISGKKINNVIVVQPGNNGICLGKATLKLEQNGTSWHCVDKSSELLSVVGVEADQQLLALVDPYEKATQAWLNQPIGQIEGDMLVHDAMDIRLKDNALMAFINHVQMVSADVDISSTALFDNQAPGFPENVTMRDIVSNYIYPNTLKVIRISGQDMKDALERTSTYFKQYTGGKIEVNPSFTMPKPQHYNYDMWAGIDYLINISRPFGDRIVQLDYKGKPVDMQGEYDVVMSNYRAGGGGEYFMYKGKPVIKEVPIDMSELIANYFLEKRVVKVEVNNNWRVIYEE